MPGAEFGEAVTIEGGGVEIADPSVPCSLDHGVRLGVRDRLQKIADGREPEGKGGDRQFGAAERVFLGGVHFRLLFGQS